MMINGAAVALAVLGLARLLPVAGVTAEPKNKEAATSKEMPKVTIYHLEGRRSERIIWLMEELGLPYDLKYVPGTLATVQHPPSGSRAALPAPKPAKAE